MSWLRGLIAAGVANPVYSNVLMICILVGGYYAATGLVTETYPQFSLDRISITVEYPGAGPEEVEQAVATKVEEALEGLAGVRRVWSRSDENGCLVIVLLEEDAADARLMLLDVKDRINQIDTFPPDVRPPVVSEITGRCTLLFKISAWNCIKLLLTAAPPSTLSTLSRIPASFCMASTRSRVWNAMDSSAARAKWPAVVPRVIPNAAPRA